MAGIAIMAFRGSLGGKSPFGTMSFEE